MSEATAALPATPVTPSAPALRSPLARGVLARHGLAADETMGETTVRQPRKDGALREASARDDAFDRWFAASKVRDDHGAPLTVFHGTTALIDSFRADLPGAFFSSSAAVAEAYAERRGAGDPSIMPVHLSVQQPLVVDAQGNDWDSIPYTSHLREAAEHARFNFAGYEDGTIDTDTLARLARAAQYDGVIIENLEDGKASAGRTTEYIVFRPEQIKSAIGNVGTFDVTDPDIRFARRADVTLPAADPVEADDVNADSAADPDADHFAQLEKTGFWGRAGAGAIIMARDTGRLLMPERSDEVLEPGTYGTWGGAIDPGEDPARAVRREVMEEAGYDGHVELVPLLVFEAPGFRYHNYLAIVDHEFTPELNWETASANWRAASDWPAPLHPGVQALLADPASMATLAKELAKIQYARWEASASNTALPTAHRDSPEFASWIEGSCAIDATGAPMVFFHGTRASFSRFEAGRGRSESPDPGFFFTTDPVVAAQYAGCHERFPAPDIGSVMAVHLRLTNPLVHDFEGGKYARKEVIARAIAGGHDGVVMRNHFDVGGVGDQWVVFAPEQIKSLWNAGTFDPANPDIRFARAGADALPPAAINVSPDGPDAAHDVTSSEAFRQWFGRSAIVTPEGRPQRMYHGSQQDITTFEPSLSGALGPGVYLSSDPIEAAFWARNPGNAARNILPVYVAIQNPYVWQPEDDFRWPLEVNADARRAGHDGIIKQWADGCEVCAFEPHQLKSVFNLGSYDASNPDIRYARDAGCAIVATPAIPSRQPGPAKATRDDSYEP